MIRDSLKSIRDPGGVKVWSENDGGIRSKRGKAESNDTMRILEDYLLGTANETAEAPQPFPEPPGDVETILPAMIDESTFEFWSDGVLGVAFLITTIIAARR